MKYSKPKTKRKYKRAGQTTKAERAIVKALVKDSPSEITPIKTQQLAKVFNRSVSTVKKMLQKAREDFTADASFYVDAHRSSVEGALATFDFDVARKGAAWAIQNLSGEGKRIVDKAEAGPSGVRIMVGVRLGGVVQSEADVDVAGFIEGTTVDEPTDAT